MALIGYARTSTVEQIAGLEAQITELAKLNCERIYEEQVSSVAERQELNRCLDYVRDGDQLVVTKLDRLARSMFDLMNIVKTLESKGCGLKVLGMGLDTGTPQGMLMLNVFGSVAQFERQIMLERQQEGIARAKAEGKYKGRKPTDNATKGRVQALIAQGVKQSAICSELGIGKTNFYKIKGELLKK